MADELSMAVAELLRKAGVEQDDWLRESVRLFAQSMAELELEQHLDAERHERTPERTGYRNGTRERLHGCPLIALVSDVIERHRPGVLSDATQMPRDLSALAASCSGRNARPAVSSLESLAIILVHCR